MKSRLLLAGIILVTAGIARADFPPIAITQGSYNADVIVENTATPVLKIVTDASMDTGTNNTADTWMEIGNDPANPGFGFPHPNTTFNAVSNANYSFKTAPSYTSSPNGILVDGSGSTGIPFHGGTFTLV